MDSRKTANEREAASPLELEKREKFARLIVDGLNNAAAYRQAYNVGPTTAAATVWAAASALRYTPAVNARIAHLMDLAARQAVVSAAQLMRQWYDIATADPNELIRNVVECCRYCNGDGFRFQWTDADEFVRACEEHERVWRGLAAGEMTINPSAPKERIRVPDGPSFDGGVGYWPSNPPNPCCPRCFGNGVERQYLGDTTKLSPGARLLYKGVKVTKNGIEVLMHDQHAARDALAKCLGAYKLEGALPPTAPDPSATADDGPALDPAQSYMRLVKG